MRGKYCSEYEQTNLFAVPSLTLVVSVPLRGKYCSECAQAIDLASEFLAPVSVPLRGKYCSEWEEFKLWLIDYPRVSVPLRGKYCSEYDHRVFLDIREGVSVPLRGKYCSES